MTQLVHVRGLNRRGVRIGGKTLTSTQTYAIDLDDAVTRRDVSKHSAIGAIVVVGGATAAIKTGGVAVSPGTGLTFSSTSGSIVRNDGSTVAVSATTNTALTTADGTNPRIDLVVVDQATGAVSKVDGTAAATPTPPITPAGKLAVATIRVPTSATTVLSANITNVAVRL